MSSSPYRRTTCSASIGSGFSQPNANSPIGRVGSASIPLRWRRRTIAESGVGWAHAGPVIANSNKTGARMSDRIGE
ncbi:hypothetical protein [Singulisphaera sp. PoT]|uniref:hypothetical protein n=1 Tax=Singulisphaera sp. PoT TaxID=3411797 RepID=UPI003BF59349